LKGKINMAGRDGQGQSFSPGSRKRDRSIDDALRTMERLPLGGSELEETVHALRALATQKELS
jgi:hypothetical protein